MSKIFKSYLILFVTFMASMWANPSDDSIQLWGVYESPYFRKVVSVLEEKQLKYEVNPILPKIILETLHQPVPAKFQEISPLGKIPAIQVGSSFNLADSAVIVAFLDKKWPSHTIYPGNDEDYAKALWFEKYSDTVITDVIHPIFIEKFIKPNVLKAETNQQLVNELQDKIPGILGYLESELSKNQGNYLVGDRLTIADIAIVHHFVSLNLSDIKLPLEKYPLLKGYLERTMAHPSIQAAVSKI